MKWLTLEQIKQQLRIDPEFTLEDALLERYGNSAEATVLNITGRTEEELKAMNPTGANEIPADVWEATVMLVDLSYQQRSPVSPVSMYAVPYTFDLLIKPYMKLTPDE